MHFNSNLTLMQGIDAQNEGRLEEARKLYNLVLLSEPHNSDAHHNLGIISLIYSKLDDALVNFKNALTNNPIQTAGIMGNIGIESSFNPEIINQSENAFGLLQLRHDRLDNFRKFQAANPEMNLIDQQMKFIFEQGDPNSPYKDAIAAKYFQEIMAGTNPESVARLFDKRFERSSGWLVDPSDPSKGFNPFGKTTKDRMNLAKDIYGYYTGEGGPTNLNQITDTKKKPESKNFIGKIRDMVSDPNFSDDLRLWANSMRYKPDQSLALSLMESKKAREEKRLLQVQKNATMSYVNNMPEGTLKNMLLTAAAGGAEMSDLIKMMNDDRKLIMNTEIKLGGEFDKHDTVKKFYGRADALRTILGNARKPSQAGDVAIVYTFMKMLDPTSTVNKGELAMAQNIGSIPTRIASLYNALLVGEVNLTADQRAGIVNSAKQTYDESKVGYEATYNHYLKKADQYGLNSENFIRRYGLNEEQYSDLTKITQGFPNDINQTPDVNLEVPFTSDQLDYDKFEQWLEESESSILPTWRTLDDAAKFDIMTKIYKQQLQAGNEAEFNKFIIQQ